MPQTQIVDADIELGAFVQDRNSGAKGVVTGHAVHISGCDRFAVTAVDTGRMESEETWYFPTELTVIDGDDVEAPGPEETDPVTEVDFVLGDVLEDDITGFEGYATTITFNLFNCPRVALTPTNSDGNDGVETDREWFDAPRTERLGDGISADYADLVESETESETGPVGEDLQTKSHGDLR
jgi:hypothetical protein